MRRVVVAGAVCLLLAGCSATPTVALTPAPDATAVGCASLIVRMPQVVGTAERRITDAQGTAAWGATRPVTLTCGVRTPEVSTLPCYPVDGVDWLFDEQSVPGARVLTTYGRDPGVQLVVPGTDVSVNDVLGALSDPVDAATAATDRACIATSDGTPATASGAPADATAAP